MKLIDLFYSITQALKDFLRMLPQDRSVPAVFQGREFRKPGRGGWKSKLPFPWVYHLDRQMIGLELGVGGELGVIQAGITAQLMLLEPLFPIGPGAFAEGFIQKGV